MVSLICCCIGSHNDSYVRVYTFLVYSIAGCSLRASVLVSLVASLLDCSGLHVAPRLRVAKFTLLLVGYVDFFWLCCAVVIRLREFRSAEAEISKIRDM